MAPFFNSTQHFDRKFVKKNFLTFFFNFIRFKNIFPKFRVQFVCWRILNKNFKKINVGIFSIYVPLWFWLAESSSCTNGCREAKTTGTNRSVGVNLRKQQRQISWIIYNYFKYVWDEQAILISYIWKIVEARASDSYFTVKFLLAKCCDVSSQKVYQCLIIKWVIISNLNQFEYYFLIVTESRWF